ncbi:DUF262 domain-containing protein [Candidatus Poribacteria bacterium]|nr:DUF262 domain-containing protein [Candidatus Poribacteria bacterium]MYA57703.1 DUF262 domain-containing protein [Candidatus Poribacteria bacterium]
MKANEISILKFLQEPKQFFVPIFQRRYSWEEKHCKQLWEDVIRVGQDDKIKHHFLGSIVYMEQELGMIGAIPRYLVIDGQQRLTTLSLLLSALSRAINGKDSNLGVTPKRLSNYYLFNEHEEGVLRYKQLLTQSDRKTLIHLLENRNLPLTNASPLLVESYEFFEKRIKEVDLETVYTGLQKLMIVSVALDRTVDNPQLIFESLNSTGISLSQADLVRNYVLMGQDLKFQKRLYEEYWFPMERLFGKKEYTVRFDRFMRDYLTLKMRQIPKLQNVYEAFKVQYPSYEIGNSVKLEAIVKEISRYAKHFVDITLLKEEDPELRECLSDFVEMRAEVAYPFLLEVYDDYAKARIEKADVIKIFRLVESYIFRRSVCGIPTNVLNKLFATLMNENNVDKNKYLESLNDVFRKMQTYRRYPTDSEFKQAFNTKDVYNFTRRNYLFRKLENFERKEPALITDYTIEHVMPRTLTEAWQQELGEDFQRVHEVWVHKIGNLTLTGYNSDYSNSPFKKKRDMPEKGLRFSPLYLNQSFAGTEQWNEDAIKMRTAELAEKACKIWIYPED